MTEPGDRAAKLARIQSLKMARSAHAYVRGSTVSFYKWLDTAPANVPDGPPVWPRSPLSAPEQIPNLVGVVGGGIDQWLELEA